MYNPPLTIARSKAGLVVVDMQERLLPVIFERERVLNNVVLLARAAATLGLPIFATEQYRQGLGPTVPEVAAAISGFAPMEKLTFSACGGPGFMVGLEYHRISDIILCGIEAHVCVLQTCLELLEQKGRVFVVADAISSRTVDNYKFALERMRDARAAIVSTEMIVFELLQRAGTDEFKRLLPLLKIAPPSQRSLEDLH
jgi:nicotinamidase-related amidase